MKKINDYFLYIVLVISFVFLILYLISYNFRQFLSCLKIDPNFLVAFTSAVTLIVSTISIKKERKYNFNLNLKSSVEDKVALIVGKLFIIMNNSEIYLNTIKSVKKAIEENKKFIDSNNTNLLVEDLNKNRELLGAYIEIYFKPFILDEWGLMHPKISKLATNCINIILNYNSSFPEISENSTLAQIDEIIKESEVLNKEIYDLTEKMKNNLLEIVVNNDKKIRDKYIN